MAGDWIKMRADLFTHPKVFRIAEILGVDELSAIGMLYSFWSWADKYSVDGRVDGATTKIIDRAIRVDGLSDALVVVGWLEFDKTGACLPRYSEHNGDSAKERLQKNQRQARWRGKKTASASTNVDNDSSTKASTREEKRREEKRIKETSSQPDALELVVDNSNKFAMHSKWYPSADLTAALPFTSLSASVYTGWEKYLGEFCLHWITKPEITRTDAEWDKAFLDCLVFNQEKSDKEMRA